MLPSRERRSLPDRRAPAPMLSRHWLRGRRRGPRRGAGLDVYVDRPARGEWAWALALLALAVVDLAWTMAHLARGIEEANPLMAWVLARGGGVGFAVLKLGVTTLGIAFLLRHARFRWTRRLVPVVLGIYCALLCVHAATELAIAST